MGRKKGNDGNAAASERPVAPPSAKWHIRGSGRADEFIIYSIRVQFSGSPRRPSAADTHTEIARQ